MNPLYTGEYNEWSHLSYADFEDEGSDCEDQRPPTPSLSDSESEQDAEPLAPGQTQEDYDRKKEKKKEYRKSDWERDLDKRY